MKKNLQHFTLGVHRARQWAHAALQRVFAARFSPCNCDLLKFIFIKKEVTIM